MRPEWEKMFDAAGSLLSLEKASFGDLLLWDDREGREVDEFVFLTLRLAHPSSERNPHAG